MKFVVALVSYLESLGYDTSGLRKSADGSKAIVHMQYAEILTKNLDTNSNVTIYDRINPDFQALLASEEWNGNVRGTPNSFGDLAELALYEARLTAQVAEAKTDMDNFQTGITGEVTAAKEDLNAIVDGYQVTVNQQLEQAATKDELSAVASPLTATLLSEMTDTTRVYVYLGVEVGYTSGNWYYHNGTAWVSGGVYQATGLSVDTQERIDNSVQAVTLTNLADDGQPTLPTKWQTRYPGLGSVTIDDVLKTATFTPTAQLGQMEYAIDKTKLNVQHEIYFRFAIKWGSVGTKTTIRVSLDYGSGAISTSIAIPSVTNDYIYVSGSIPASTNTVGTNPSFKFYENGTSSFGAVTVTDLMLYDLTDLKSKEVLKSKEEVDVFLETKQLTYFDGEYKTNDALKALRSDIAVTLEDVSVLPKPIYARVANEVLDVIAKHNATHDMQYRLGKKGPNTIFDFVAMYKIANTGIITSPNLDTGAAFWTNQTDSFSPHIIRVTTNADGDNINVYDFTGGNHNYLNGGGLESTPTGRTSALLIKVDGRTVTAFEGYCGRVDILWTNYVQATNTKKADGSGREVLKEEYRLSFDGDKWTVNYRSEIFEAVNYSRFYGLQLGYETVWNGGALFHTGSNRKWNTNSLTACNSGDKNCDRITLRNGAGTEFVEISVSQISGLGKNPSTPAATYNAFCTSYNKCYYNLINGDTAFALGDIFTFEGYYRFYSKA